MTLPRPFVTLRLLLVLALVALAAPLFVDPAANTAAAATGSAKTVEGNWHPWKANATFVDDDPNFDPYWTGARDDSLTPSVTVDRTTNLGDEVVNVSWRNFTPTSNLGSYAETVRGGKPNPVPFRTNTDDSLLYGVDILQCRGTAPTLNPRYNDDLKDRAQCYDAAVLNPTDGDYGQNNEVRAVTQNDGTGFAQFHVENNPTNDLLRCSPTQPCSLVVVPNQGGLYNNDDRDDQSTAGCEDHSGDYLKPPYESFTTFAGPDGRLSPCSWSKRIVVPLRFAPLASNCPDASTSFNAAGSPPLRRGLSQLLAGWCRGSRPVSFSYNFSTSEGEARSRFLSNAGSGFTSATDVALTSQPADPGFVGRPFTYAPVANDAVSIPYAIDNVRTGRPMTDIRLTARLVAKLLTQSYSPALWNCGTSDPPYCATAVRGNPASIFDDPEFQRLNFRGDHADRDAFPSTLNQGSQQGSGSFFPTVSSGDSDLTYAITRWIANDRDAADFLRGRRDEVSGMHVNRNYQTSGVLSYPTSQFQAQDPGWNAPQRTPAEGATDLRYYQGFQGSWNPVGSASQVAVNLVRNRSTSYVYRGDCYDATGNDAVICRENNGTIPVIFKRTAPEPNGVRDLTAVTDNTEAAAYGLPSAELVTPKGAIVGPTRDAMAAAAGAMRTNRDGITQSVDFASAPAGAYPLLLPVYAMVPTCGVTKAKAAGIRGMLGKVATSQSYGDSPGRLARGLVKLTSAQLADTRSAAGQVSAKRCPAGGSAGPVGGSSGGGGGSGVDSATAGGSGGSGSTPAPAGPTNAPAAAPQSNAATSAPPQAVTKNIGFPLDDNGGGIALLPAVLLGGALLLILGPLGWWALATAPGRTVRDRLRHLVVGTPWGRRG